MITHCIFHGGGKQICRPRPAWSNKKAVFPAIFEWVKTIHKLDSNEVDIFKAHATRPASTSKAKATEGKFSKTGKWCSDISVSLGCSFITVMFLKGGRSYLCNLQQYHKMFQGHLH